MKSHPEQLLVHHLQGVTEIALQIFDSQLYDPERREAIQKICMAHDFGKATSFFQAYIDLIRRKKFKAAKSFGSEKDHALLSALFSYWWLPEEYKLFGFLAVKRHHGKINDVSTEYVSIDSYSRLRKQVADIQKFSQPELEQIYGVKLDTFFDFVNDNAWMEDLRSRFDKTWDDRYTIEDAFELHQLHSYLLSSDKLQLIGGIPALPEQKPAWYVDDYKAYKRAELLAKNSALRNSVIFNIREEIYADLQAELAKVNLNSEAFFSINAPTGTGKTFLAYDAALYFSNKIGRQSSVIYTLPYMSIIDQNYDELLKIIKHNQGGVDPKESEVLKHHSLSEVKYETDDGEYKEFDARFCYDNWQSRIVTTTFVQLCNTIFKIGDNSIAHRFNRFKDAVIILDEVQAIDEKFHIALCDLFEILAKKYNTKFIFVSATMPMMNKARELIPDKKKYFDQLDRITIYNHTRYDTPFEDFKRIVVDDINKRSNKSFLIVMNTIAAAKAMFEYIEKNVVDRVDVYLSTEIYPKARLKAIKCIKLSKKKLVLVSTQLIEAGVDIDFDVLYRDFAPLSSLNQTAGRVNRNGVDMNKGEVHIYRLTNEKGQYFYTHIYPLYTIEITRELLAGREVIYENEIFALNEVYALKVSERLSPDRSNEIIKHMKAFDFVKLRGVTDIIESQYAYKYDIIIEGDAECTELLHKLRNIKSTPGNRWKHKFVIQNIFRKLNLYKISIYEKTYTEISGNLQKIEAFDIEYLPLKAPDGRLLYTKKKGIVLCGGAHTIMG